jgi:ATP-dependent helicase/nuclease subunit A
MAQAAGEGIPEHARTVAELALAALESEPVREAARSRHWRELFVAAPIGNVTVEGFVDLLYESPEGLVLLDYKTDPVVDDDGLDAALSHYRWQGAAYAAAVEQALGRAVHRCVFLFTTPNGARVVELPDLATLVAKVRALLASPSAG